MVFNLLNKTIKIAFIPATLFGLLTLTDSASAAALRLTSGATTKTVYDNTAQDLDSDAGIVVTKGSIGAFSHNVTGGVTKPLVGSTTNPYLDLFNLSVSSKTAGTLNVQFTETGFTSGNSIMNFLTSVGGTTSGNIIFNVYADSNNTAFNTSNKLGTLTSSGLAISGTAFAGSDIYSFLDSSSTTPYSITLEAVITHKAGGGTTSFDYELKKTSVPEPASAAALLALGLVGAATGAGKAVKRNG